jgi:hypothetical protein
MAHLTGWTAQEIVALGLSECQGFDTFPDGLLLDKHPAGSERKA